jgi:hypothetical protein
MLGWHPEFLRVQTACTRFVMREDGPLPAPLRHYIAMVAAAVCQCDQIVLQQVCVQLRLPQVP